MHRSSQSIASLAAALAKAQAELVNPEKSLVATIASGHRGGPVQSFRYAPLSSGLDIVRKTLGQHEIATMQTMAIDQTGPGQSDHGAGACLGRVDRFGLARLRHSRYRHPAPDGSSADLRPALCAVYVGRNCRRPSAKCDRSIKA